MTNEELNQLHIVALNRNNSLIHYKHSEYLTVLQENGCRQLKIVKVFPSETAAKGYIERT